MALETVVYSQDPFNYYGFKDFYSLLGGSNWGYDLSLQQQGEEFDQEHKSSLIEIFNNNIMNQTSTQNVNHDHFHANWDYHPSSAPQMNIIKDQPLGPTSSPESQIPTPGRRKRRRARRSGKNKEELETQRMTHIAVERNRRKQMNDYLAVLRSLMPPSYAHRGDQASIIGGAINFVKELEQFLHSNLESRHKRTKTNHSEHDHEKEAVRLAEFFTFPQYSTRANHDYSNNDKRLAMAMAMADIEVTMVDSHVNLKILAKKRPRLLLRVVAGLEALGLGVLHLNVTTADHMVLYSLSVKVEEGSQLNSADDIAASVNQMLGEIQEQPVFT